jgi:hypothetical protein
MTELIRPNAVSRLGKFAMNSLRLVLLLLLLPGVSGAFAAEGLQRIKYNHPGLVVDLGVGLWAWPVPWDVDGDGDHDLIVVCPDKPYNGTYLFENTSGPREKLPIFKAAKRLGAGKHYTMPSYVDGGLRVLTAGFEHPDFLKSGIDASVKLPLPANIHKTQVGKTAGPFKVRHNQWRYVDYDGDGALDLIVAVEDWADYGWDDAWDSNGRWTNGPLHGLVYLVRNSGSTDQPKYAEPVLLEADGLRIDTFGCPSPNFADFDGDGDLDLLCGEFLDGFTYFENIGSRKQPKYTKGRRLMHGDQPLTMDLEMIVPVVFDWDKDGDFDLIVGDEDGRVAFLENTGRVVDRLPQFEPPRYFQQEADELQSGALATPVGFDWDGDGDIDIVSGNTSGYIEFFENLSGPNVASPKWAAAKRLTVVADAGSVGHEKTFRVMAGPNGSIQGPAEAKWGYTTLNVADWDADGLPDIVFNSIWGQVQWLRNIGTRTSPLLAEPQPIAVEWPAAPPKPDWTWWNPRGKELVTQWRTTPVLADWNGDGLIDLAMLDHEGYLAFFERRRSDGKSELSNSKSQISNLKSEISNLKLLPPRRAFLDEKGQPLHLNAGRAGKSGRRKLCATDWDGDGKLDLLVNSENANWLRQVESRDGTWLFTDIGKLDSRNIASHDVSPTTVDWDGDGIPDFLGGAEDGFFYFLKNPRH